MALQIIDTVNIPAIVDAPDVSLQITKCGRRSYIGSFDPANNNFKSVVQWAAYGETLNNLVFAPFTAKAKYVTTYFSPEDYASQLSFFRLFVDNYATISNFKLIFKIANNFFSPDGAKIDGYVSGVESRLRLYASSVDIKTTPVWTNYYPTPGGTLALGTNLVDSIVKSTEGTYNIATITFNAAGRALMTGVTAGFVDLWAWILPTLCWPVPEPEGYCLTADYSSGNARIEINY